jgi:superfamily II DNA or RNA helicase
MLQFLQVYLQAYFGEAVVSVDLVAGLRRGFLANVDYRMYTDNINWEALHELKGKMFSPRAINRTLFINQWDDAVVYEQQSAWKEQANPRAIVFCGTIDHALTMRDKINALGFCSAAAIYSQSVGGKAMAPHGRNRVLSDFHDGTINVVCAVDIPVTNSPNTIGRFCFFAVLIGCWSDAKKPACAEYRNSG